MSGSASNWRDVDGILLLDKPAGMSSNGALQRARRLFRARKAGHAGSLDPFATGMLPVCFGQATKVCGFLLDQAKTYEVGCRLGVRTETGDPEGEIIEQQEIPELANSQVEEVLQGFVGEIDQIPPMYSALKHQGKRLYELARKGVEIERKPRRVTIHEIGSVRLDDDRIGFTVRCSKGTYIRSLVEDLADRLGTVAHTESLRRIQVEPFEPGHMATLEMLEASIEGQLLPVDSALIHLPRTELDPIQARALLHGQAVPSETEDRVPGVCRVYDSNHRFLGIGEWSKENTLKPRRLMAFRDDDKG